MNPLAVSLIAFVVIFGGAFLGVLLRRALAGHHLDDDAKDVVRLGTGLIGTIAALVLGLIIASAKSSYDTQSSQVQYMTDRAILATVCSSINWPAHTRRAIFFQD